MVRIKIWPDELLAGLPNTPSPHTCKSTFGRVGGAKKQIPTPFWGLKTANFLDFCDFEPKNRGCLCE